MHQLVYLFAGLALLAVWGDGRADETDQALRVEVKEDLVTLNVRGVAIKDVLKAIAHQQKLRLVLHGTLDEPITLEFHQLPFPKAVERVLRHKNFAFRYARYSTSTKKGEHPNKLWVFSEGPGYFTNRHQNEKQTSFDGTSSSTSNKEETVRTLNFALTHQDEKVRVKAVRSLADLGGDQAVAVASLTSALNDESVMVRAEAVNALGEIGGEAVVPILEQVLNDTHNTVLKAVIEVCAEIGGDQSVSVLTRILQDSDPSIRLLAVHALGQIGGWVAMQGVQQGLKDKDVTVREAAIEVFADIGGEQSIRALADVLRDKDVELRTQAVIALGEIGSPSAIRVLQQALQDQDNTTQTAVKKVLARLPY